MWILAKLTALKVKKTTAPGFYGDGRNLWFKVSPSGSRSWVFRYTFARRARMMGLGAYPEVSLEAARELASQQRALLKNPFSPQDPLDVRQAVLQAQRLAESQQVTFAEAAQEFVTLHEHGWKNKKHAAQWRNTLEAYAMPVLGSMPVAQVRTDDVLAVLKPIWVTKTETASRVRQRMEKVLDWAISKELRQDANPARWSGHLENHLPKPSKVKPVVHHAALEYVQAPVFMQQLQALSGVPALALEFLILTATRTGEVLGAQWSEIDFEKQIWIIPAGRIKGAKEQRIPLPPRAIKILEQQKTADADLIFMHKKKKLSNAALLQVLKKQLGYDSLTVHGLRSTFRDWAGEETDFAKEVIEHALAHKIKDKAEAAYARKDQLQKRRKLMQAWQDFLLPRHSAES